MIPYYEKDVGIKSHEGAPEGTYYVVLDRAKVDKLDPNIWNTFDAVRAECEEELSQFLEEKGWTNAPELAGLTGKNGVEFLGVAMR